MKKTRLFTILIAIFVVCETMAERPKIGLVFGGGGAKGAAEVGVLKVLEQAGVQVDYIVGTSIGSIVGGLYLDSQALEANAWHHRSDALSSVGTAIGIGGAIFLGQRWTVLDPLASIVVSLLIVKVAFDLLGNGIGDLTERSLPDNIEQEMLSLVSALPGVVEPHNLRTRRLGNHYAIELHIRMDGDITLREAHDKATEVEHLLRDRYGKETHIAVHVEPKAE